MNPSDHPALQEFADGPHTLQRGFALKALMAARVFQKVIKTTEFERGVEALLGAARDQEGEGRLEALVELVRISQAARSLAKEVPLRVAPLLDAPLPPHMLVKIAEDRAYVARAAGWSSAPWVLPYAVTAIVQEDGAETVRAAFAQLAVERGADIAAILDALRKEACQLRIETEAPADSLAIRLTRILNVLRTAIATSRLAPGERPGTALAELVKEPLIAVGVPKQEDRLVALARELILCTHDIVRTRFALAAETESYAAIQTARRFFGASNWPAALRPDLDLVVDCILEAILLLARQGIAASALADQLRTLAQYRERADVLLKALADDHPELDESVRNWLRQIKPSRGTRPLNDALISSAELRVDPLIGAALIEAKRLETSLSSVRELVLTSLRIYDPSLAPALEQHALRAEALVLSVTDLAARRQVGLLGGIDEQLTFAPKFFEVASGVPGGMVRVLRPAVVRSTEGLGAGEVISKGLVDPIG